MTTATTIVNPDEPVWGARAIAQVLNLKTEEGEPDERAAFHLLSHGLVDADKIGSKWVSTRRRLLAKLTASKAA